MTAGNGNENRHLSQAAPLKGKFSPAAKQRIADFLASIRSFEPTLGLLYGDVAGVVAGRPSWSITAFAPATVAEMTDMYASFGAVVTYDLDGFRVLVPQMAHIGELDGGVLDFKDNRLILTAPSAA